MCKRSVAVNYVLSSLWVPIKAGKERKQAQRKEKKKNNIRSQSKTFKSKFHNAQSFLWLTITKHQLPWRLRARRTWQCWSTSTWPSSRARTTTWAAKTAPRNGTWSEGSRTRRPRSPPTATRPSPPRTEAGQPGGGPAVSCRLTRPSQTQMRGGINAFFVCLIYKRKPARSMRDKRKIRTRYGRLQLLRNHACDAWCVASLNGAGAWFSRCWTQDESGKKIKGGRTRSPSSETKRKIQWDTEGQGVL